MIHFALTHATYREPPTMPATVASLHAAGVEHVTLFPDGGVWGAFRNTDRALRYLVEVANGEDHVCVVDDDLVVWKDALVILQASLDKDADTPHTLYTVQHSIRHLDLSTVFIGWVDLEPSWAETWGGMVVMTRHVADLLINHPFWLRLRQTDKIGKHNDVAIFETLRLMGLKVRAHIPSLTTDNSGGSSTIGTDNKGELAGYRYDEWESPPAPTAEPLTL